MPRAKIVMEKIKRQKAVKETVAKNMENLLNGTLPYCLIIITYGPL